MWVSDVVWELGEHVNALEKYQEGIRGKQEIIAY